MSNWGDMALVGRIARPHGLRGDVVVHPETDFVEDRFRVGGVVWTLSDRGMEPLTIRAMRVQNGRPVVAFAGSGRVEDVERLVGLELRVPEEELRPLGKDTYYHHHLVGCTVETSGGDTVGTVVRLEGSATRSRLVVEGAHGEVLIPLVLGICVDIDVNARRIRIEPPEGLLEVNETKRGKGGR